MDGETYTTISRISESGIADGYSLNFLGSADRSVSLFVVRVRQKLERSKYLVEDASGKGVLDTSRLSPEQVAKFIRQLPLASQPAKRPTNQPTKRPARQLPTLLGKQLQVIGAIEPHTYRHRSTPQAYAVLGATELSLFSYLSALHLMLGEAPCQAANSSSAPSQ